MYTRLVLFSLLSALAVCSLPTPDSEKDEEFNGPIRICRKGTDAQINGCFMRILNDLRPKLAGGIPEIGLQPLDPFYFEKLRFQQASGRALVVKALFTNITVRHLSIFENAEFKIDSKRKLLLFNLTFPKVRLEGIYKLDGNVFIFPLGGTGPYWFQLAGVNAKGYCPMKLVNPSNGTKYVQVDKVNLDLTIKDIKVELLNLFNGNEILGPVINNILNENSQDLFQEVKGETVKIINGIIENIANAIMKNMPFLTVLVE